MTRKQFIKAVGREPEKDDLERANCRRAGEPGHQTCGICEHGKPVFECWDICMRKPFDKIKRITDGKAH